VNDVNTLRNTIAAASAGSELTLTTVRNGNRQKVKVKLGAFNGEATGPSRDTRGGNGTVPGGRLGLRLTPVTPEIASQLGAGRGTQGLVVASVDPAGPAASAGIREGDIIQQVNRQPVRSAADVQAALNKAGDRPSLLQVLRQGQSIFVAVR
jgi:serine protease Do